MRHTSRPWFLDLENDRYITVHAEHRDICDMITDFGDVAEAEANGKLIAAAPDMKEALEWYEEKVRGCIGMAPEAEEARYALSVDAGERARLALEKARGEK